jgi:hypothetical protein
VIRAPSFYGLDVTFTCGLVLSFQGVIMRDICGYIVAACLIVGTAATAEPEPGFRADLDGDTWAELFAVSVNKTAVSLTIRRPDEPEIAIPNMTTSRTAPVFRRSGGRSVTMKTRPVWSHPNFSEQTLTISFVNGEYLVTRMVYQTQIHSRGMQTRICDVNFVTGAGTFRRTGPASATAFTVPASAPKVTDWTMARALPAPCL